MKISRVDGVNVINIKKIIMIQTLKYVFAYIIIATKSLYDLVKLLQCPGSAYFFHMKINIRS